MAVQMSVEQMPSPANGLGGSDLSDLLDSSAASTVNPSNVYELNSSESLTFLYNLLYDDESTLTKTDILNILSSLKEREGKLPFALTEMQPHMNVQGVSWGPVSGASFTRKGPALPDRHGLQTSPILEKKP
ncbi:hypothetical protein OXX80_007437 [Metschnikowia pulcherrima]